MFPVRDTLEFMEDIKEMDSVQIYNVMRFEQPQTIAFILSNLDADKGSEVLLMMLQMSRNRSLKELVQ